MKEFIYSAFSNDFYVQDFDDFRESFMNNSWDIIESKEYCGYAIKKLYGEIMIDDDERCYDAITRYFDHVLESITVEDSTCMLFITGYYENEKHTPYFFFVTVDGKGVVDCYDYYIDRYEDIIKNKRYHENKNSSMVDLNDEIDHYKNIQPLFSPIISDWISECDD